MPAAAATLPIIDPQLGPLEPGSDCEMRGCPYMLQVECGRCLTMAFGSNAPQLLAGHANGLVAEVDPPDSRRPRTVLARELAASLPHSRLA